MNIRLLCKQLGLLSFLIGAFMVLSLPWAWPALGQRYGINDHASFEARGFWALLISTMICVAVGVVLYRIGRKADTRMYRKEAMAIVGLSWILATALGAMPYLLSETHRGPSVRIFDEDESPQVITNFNLQFFSVWQPVRPLDPEQYQVIKALIDHSARGLDRRGLRDISGVPNADEIFRQIQQLPGWKNVLIAPGDEKNVPADRNNHYRIHWVPMTVIDALFESQSGFSTTGATVISDLEDDYHVPYCILFWRSSTQFLGGLGIIVLFVAVLGQGSAGKALMRAEMPGPTQEGAAVRMQHSAWVFAAIYAVLTLILAVILMVIGISPYDALCHAFTTIATGGFSTYNDSIGHFAMWNAERGVIIEYVIVLFMILGGTNFLLFYLCLLRQPGKLFADAEWQVYLSMIVIVTAVIVTFGMINQDQGFERLDTAFRYGLFQVVAILTTTGYATNDFDQWNQLGRIVILVLMFIGGCAGSTSGGMKVIRHILFVKILRLEIVRTFAPRTVRILRVGGKSVDDHNIRLGILFYFGLVIILMVASTLFVVAFESNLTFGPQADHKLLDSASAVAASLNNIGPALGTVGPTENYGHFTGMSKLLFVWLMMLGRLEIFPIIVLFFPRFWRDQ